MTSFLCYDDFLCQKIACTTRRIDSHVMRWLACLRPNPDDMNRWSCVRWWDGDLKRHVHKEEWKKERTRGRGTVEKEIKRKKIRKFLILSWLQKTHPLPHSPFPPPTSLPLLLFYLLPVPLPSPFSSSASPPRSSLWGTLMKMHYYRMHEPGKVADEIVNEGVFLSEGRRMGQLGM